jgi:erythronate-4-phosphate dehydrogenase
MLSPVTLRIVADRNIPFISEAFAPLGDVLTLPSSELTAAAVRDADLLFVRSTVKVGPALLTGSRVRFVATATIGIDHLDTDWLAAQQIAWASAPGSNADSVMQWMAVAIATLAVRRNLDLSLLRVGIVGVGNVGSRVEKLWRAFGVEPFLCDPPRARNEGATHFVAIDDLLQWSDLVTLHVPLERHGDDATHHLVDERRLALLRPSAFLINASRGEVVDGAALEAALYSGRIAGALLDVFEHEPSPVPSLVEACILATPHIAGHSLDGKANGTQAVYEAACRHLQIPPTFSARAQLPALVPASLELATDDLSDAQLLCEAIEPFYQLLADHEALARIIALPDEERGTAFQRYRQSYPLRRELTGARITLRPRRPLVERVLTALGAYCS